MSYSLHPRAETDLADVIDFYREQAGLAVATRFLDEFERVAQLLVQHPGFGTHVGRGRRSFPLRYFPYSVVYRALDNDIRVLIVRHHHRKPGYAASRQ
jgi:plasmid stabilization system protein ParE